MAQAADIQNTPLGLPEYLNYAPTPFLAVDKSNRCYRALLDRLGFKPENDRAATDMRINFINDLRSHTCVPETMFLRKEDNSAAFDALVQGFFTTYGQTYWGSCSRNHLVVSDPSKGFLHPRDSQRVNSRLIKVMEELFNYKARTARTNDAHRQDIGKFSRLPNINLAALDPDKINQLGKVPDRADVYQFGNALNQAEVNKPEKAPLGIEAAFREIDKMRESMEVQSYASSEGDPEFYDEIGQERQPTETQEVSDNRLTKATGNEHPGPEAESDLPLTGSTAAVRTGRRNKRRVNYREVMEGPYNPKRSRVKKPGGLFAPRALETRTRVSRRLSHASPTLSDPGYDSARDAPHNASGAVSLTATRDSTHNATRSPADEPKTPKTEQLPNDISSKVFLVVIASNQQNLAPVTVTLDHYTSTHKGFHNFVEFLAQECELGDLSKDVTGISATYTWSGRRHRLRKDKMDADGNIFLDHIVVAFEEHAGFAKKRCEVEMLLHVAL